MAVKPSDLHAVPLFHGITDDHLAKLIAACDQLELPEGEVLFEAGSEAKHFYLLTSGEVSLIELRPIAMGVAPFAAGGPRRMPQVTPPASPSDPAFRDSMERVLQITPPTTTARFVLHPVAPIGELGAVTGLHRNTTAKVTKAAEVLRIEAARLRLFFERHGDVAFPFYHNLLGIVTEKVRRDTHRIDETRANLIRTQRGMKRLLERVLEAEETPLSKFVTETLEELIEHNRRSHYVVEPTSTLASWVRLDSGSTVAVKEISDERLRIAASATGLTVGSDWSGVLVLPGAEVPLSGEVESSDASGAVIKLDLLIASYAATMTDYLTRVQMLDFVV